MLYRKDRNRWRIEKLRRLGVVIGRECLIHTMEFSTEPYLIEIGDRVVVSHGTQLITHDGSVWIMRDEYPGITVFGRIRIGNNSFIGTNSILLPGCDIGSNCIVGAGSVVRGKIPDDSVVMGNPAEVIMTVSDIKAQCLKSKGRLDCELLSPSQKKEALCRMYNIIE